MFAGTFLLLIVLIVVVVVLFLPKTTTTTTTITTTSATTITTSFITSFTKKQTLKYGTPGDGGGSGIGWVVMVVAVMVGYLWWWLPSGCGHGGNCCKCGRFYYEKLNLVYAWWQYFGGMNGCSVVIC